MLAGGQFSFGIHRHLWKQERTVRVPERPRPLVWSSTIQAPVPGGKDQNVRYPEGSGRTQQLSRAHSMLRQCVYEKSKRANHSQGYHTVEDVADHLIESMIAAF